MCIRDSYIAAGFAGVIALALMLFQPLLAVGYLPGLTGPRGRYVHRRIGVLLIISIVVHVAGLWITSPPDVMDALLFVSPTPFSIWGVIAMWSLFVSASLVMLRRKLRLRARTWRLSHKTLAAVIVVGSVIHAMMIEGTMETLSKSMLSVLALGATVLALTNPWLRK